MFQIKKLRDTIFNIYFGIGVVSIAILALSVIFTVIARYCFSLSWKQVSEFNVTTFAFSTFWGMGVCILRGEHVMIDIIYDRIKPSVKRWLSVFNYIIVLFIDILFTYFSFKYAKQAGIQISQGMEIPMIYMYGIMPLSGAICAICIVLKIAEYITAPLSYFEPKNKVLTADDNK